MPRSRRALCIQTHFCLARPVRGKLSALEGAVILRGMNRRVEALASKVLDGASLSRNECMELAALDGQDRFDFLYWANRIRRHFVGDAVHLCSIISVRTGGCPEDCAFCAQSARHAANVPTTDLLPFETVLAAACASQSSPVERFGMVSSGDCAGREQDFARVIEYVERLRVKCPDLGLCASLGRLSEQQARQLRAAGLTRINHNLETSERFFPRICSTHTWTDRVATARAIKSAGLGLCCGGIFGLGETWEDRIDLALALRELGADVVPINFLNPIPGTPLQGRGLLPPLTALHIIALYRFILPRAEIKLCGGREITLRDLQSWMFYAGANATMAGNYLTTAGRPAQDDVQMIRDLGLSLERAGE